MPLRNSLAVQRCSMNTCSSVRISTLDLQPHPRLFGPLTAGLRPLHVEAALLVAEMPEVALVLLPVVVLPAVAVVQRADAVLRGLTSCATRI